MKKLLILMVLLSIMVGSVFAAGKAETESAAYPAKEIRIIVRNSQTNNALT